MVFDPKKYQKDNPKYTPKTYGKTSNKKVTFKYAAVPKENVNTLEGLQNYANKLGMDVDIKPKESLFKKTVDFISRPLYASAGAAKALVKNYQAGTTVENPLLEAWKGLTEQEKETYSDVLAEAGVHNKWVKGGVGFALDVALDPTTYFGGAIIKGAGKVLGAGGRTAMKGITKFDPVVAQNLTATGKSIQDAFGRAFVKYSGGSTAKVMKDGKEITRYLGDDIGRALNKLGMEKEGILKKYVDVFGELSVEEQGQFVDKLVSHKKQLVQINKEVKSGKLEEFNKLFGGNSPVKGVRHAEKRFGGAKGFEQKFEKLAGNATERYQKILDNFTKKLERIKKTREVKLSDKKDLLEFKIGDSITQKTAKLQAMLEKVLKDEVNLFTGDLADIQKSLKGGIEKGGLLKGTVKELAEPTKDEFDDIIKSVVNPIRDDMEDVIKDLQEMVKESSGKEFLSKGLGFTNSKEGIAKMLREKTITTQNDYNKLVFEMEDKVNAQINKMRQAIAEKMATKKTDITGKILKVQNEVGVKKTIAEDFFKSRKTAREMMDKIAPDFTEKEIKFFQEKYAPLIDNIAKMAGIPDDVKWKYYYPFIDKTKIGTFSEMGGSIMEKTKEGYLKEFRDLIADENILKKPIEALTRREAEIVRNNLAEELSKDAIQTYGASLDDFKTLSDGDFLTKFGRPKSEYQVVKSSMFGKELGALRKRDVELVKETLFPEMKTIDMLAKSVGYDGFTNIFKSAVTAWFPAFHVRNFISGIIQNYQVLGKQAFNPKNLGEGITMLKGSPNKMFNYKNFSGTAEELNKVFRENFETSSRYLTDLSKEIDILADGSYNLSKLNPRRLGNYIESLQKSQMVAAALRKGSTVDEAMRLARESGFDYTRITPFESKIMRRLVPFYSFARFNAELQLKTAVKNPERILNQIKFTQNLSEVFGGGKPTENDLAGLPNWALAGLGFKISGNRYLTKFGLPLEEFVNRVNDPMMSTLTSVNPIIKYPLESKLGYDFFREKKITDINQIAPGTGELLMSDKTPDWLKEIMNVQKSEYLGKVRYTASPEALHKLRNLPTARLQSTLESLFSNEKESVDKWLAFFSGARVYDIDTELQKYFKEKDMFEDIKQQMLLQGDIKEFNRVFIPNNEAK